jgi:hypothetical protein
MRFVIVVGAHSMTVQKTNTAYAAPSRRIVCSETAEHENVGARTPVMG